ncbi:MAG: diphosphomevalonate decarboxylase [Gammaproteobacteria bacterium]|nr:diphosphomevalonate decarboxylase [Gammaproteobacteria bacterium]
MQAATAYAHPNIALVKYWGKSDDELNIPATPSLAITLGDLRTTSHVEESASEVVVLDGEVVNDAKLERWLELVRKQYDLPLLHIESSSDFPASSGLASSASGFAALTVAISNAFDLGLSLEDQCDWARLGSGSAARSIHGGFVALEPEEDTCRVSQVLDASAWDLSIVIAITSDRAKTTGSTAGMTASRDASPFYDGWLRATMEAFDQCLVAVRDKDFDTLARIAEASCRQMHALMLSTEPALIYWNAATLNCIEAVTGMHEDGIKVFYTIDAGSHLKAVCEADAESHVSERLSGIEGVHSVITSRIGGPARILV